MDEWVEDWQPSASIETLRERARLLAAIREFFYARAVMEVETPVLGRGGSTDCQLDSLSLEALTPDGRERLWLQTSPEFHMKRLLAAGSGPIYQLSRVFRDGEVGRRHNIEFTLLEWYRPGWTIQALIDEVGALIDTVLERAPAPPLRRRYRELFASMLGVDPLDDRPATLAALRRLAAVHSGGDSAEWSRDNCCDLLMSLVIEPQLGREGPEAVIDYPASQAALARRHIDREGAEVASRFEIYLDGIELANGFDELTDADEQAARFEADNAARVVLGKPEIPPDHALIAALEAGMPPGAGVALGVDRLIMLALGRSRIEEVMAFSSRRC